MKHLISNNINLLKQLSEVLNQLKEEEYQLPLEVYSGSSMGQHTRHILSFFKCLLQGKETEIICFDNRERNKSIENFPAKACEEIEEIIKKIQEISSDKNVLFESTIDGQRSSSPSTISRELLYVIEHTVHHMAIIKMGALIKFPTVNFPSHFGVAQSTIDYQKTCVQ